MVKKKDEKKKCPRCGKKRVLKALSRRNKKCDICSACGEAEALFDQSIAQAKNCDVPEKKIKEAKVEESAWLKKIDKPAKKKIKKKKVKKDGTA